MDLRGALRYALTCLPLLLLSTSHAQGQTCQTTVQNKVGDTILVTATLFTTDPNENGEGESLTVASSGGEISFTTSSYNLASSVSYVAVDANETITGVLNGFDDDETCTIGATLNPAPGFTPSQKHTASQAALATGLTGIGAGVAFTLLCASGAGTPLCIGLLALGTIGGASSLSLGYISSDPADSNYMQIAKPVIGTIPHVQPGSGLTAEEADAFNAVFNVDAQIYGVGFAAYTSANRAQGAKNANNSFWEQRQLSAAAGYNKILGGLLNEDIEARSQLNQVLSQAGVTATITPADVMAVEEQIAISGLPAQAANELTALGLSSTEIQQVAGIFLAQDINAVSGTFPGILVSQGYVDAMTAASKAFLGAPTSCSITSSSLYFSTGRPVTFTASVKSASGAPVGSVSFVDSANSQVVLGTAPLVNGVAKITVVLQPLASQWIKAVYSGANGFQSCQSTYIPEYNP